MFLYHAWLDYADIHVDRDPNPRGTRVSCVLPILV